MDIIAIGAESIIYRDKNTLLKRRIQKNYRIKEIDNKIRKVRTKSEAKLLQKLDFSPKVISVDEKNMEIKMEFIDGNLIRDTLDKLSKEERKKLCIQIGEKISEMHNKDIIHGDLTTSNIIQKNNEVFFIDFGLGFISKRLEDKATDLRLLRQALESKHYRHFKENYQNILKGYQKDSNSKEVLDWLESKVEKRGRYKRKKK